jgi:precorrin-2/cobalt-factor-2 C20-methyltransferase
LIGVGTGPGDPELLTLKAVRALAEADVVAHFAKDGRNGNARATVAGYLRPGVVELALLYPVTTEIATSEPAYCSAIADFYVRSAESVEAHLRAGRTVAVLSEGDPLFYGSYMHLHVRLAPRYRAEVIPGITAMSGSWSQAGLPLVQGDDVLSVLPGTMPEVDLVRRLGECEAAVIMKVGRNLGKIRRALASAGKLARAVYVERATMDATASMRLADKPDDRAPYFSLVLVPGWEGRP